MKDIITDSVPKNTPRTPVLAIWCGHPNLLVLSSISIGMLSIKKETVLSLLIPSLKTFLILLYVEINLLKIRI
jgi:hypothetical protein